jgi:hypothetical protein
MGAVIGFTALCFLFGTLKDFYFSYELTGFVGAYLLLCCYCGARCAYASDESRLTQTVIAPTLLISLLSYDSSTVFFGSRHHDLPLLVDGTLWSLLSDVCALALFLLINVIANRNINSGRP